MLKKSAFYDFLDRRDCVDFDRFQAETSEDEQYINWNEYLLPNDYGDAEAEYTAIRNSCAIFDVSPIRKIRIRGVNAGTFFDRLLTRPVSQLPAMRAAYTVFCNDDGSFKDDAILYKFADDDYLIMPSDIDHSPYFRAVCKRYGVEGVSFNECTAAWAGLAVQGPQSAAVLSSAGITGVEELRPFEVRDYLLGGHTIKVSRMGFTADLGYECWFEPAAAEAVAAGIESARGKLGIAIPGYGLDALQACRLEGGFIVAGWDCATELEPNPGFERSPFELGLGWLVNLEAADFVGKDALVAEKANGSRFMLRSLQIDQKCAPPDGTKIYADDGAEIGSINCSAWSWGLHQTIGNASIKSEHGNSESAWIDVAGERLPVQLMRGPHINLDRRNEVPAAIG